MSRYYSSSKNTTKRPTCPFTLSARTLAAAILEAAKAAGMKVKTRGSCAGLDRPYVRVDHAGVAYLVTAGYVDPYEGRSCGPDVSRGVPSEEAKCAGGVLAGRIQPPKDLESLIERAYEKAQNADPEWDARFSTQFCLD